MGLRGRRGEVGLFVLGFVFGNVSKICPECKCFPKAKADQQSVSTKEIHGYIPTKFQWELNMRRARPYSGITIPLNNGYSAKCIPDTTMAQMGAEFDSSKLSRSKPKGIGLDYHGIPHFDDNLLNAAQVGSFAAEYMKMNSDMRPIWTDAIWNNFIHELNEGHDGGPPGYRNSGKSVSKAVSWVLEHTLMSCGVGGSAEDIGDPCHMSVFSAISPWAEAIIHWTASKLSRNNTKITSIDFNPCDLQINATSRNSIEKCIPTRELVQNPYSFDLSVSYSGIEHDGLGRYGDPVNPNGDVSALREIWLLTRPGGALLVRNLP